MNWGGVIAALLLAYALIYLCCFPALYGRRWNPNGSGMGIWKVRLCPNALVQRIWYPMSLVEERWIRLHRPEIVHFQWFTAGHAYPMKDWLKSGWMESEGQLTAHQPQ